MIPWFDLIIRWYIISSSIISPFNAVDSALFTFSNGSVGPYALSGEFVGPKFKILSLSVFCGTGTAYRSLMGSVGDCMGDTSVEYIGLYL